MSEGGRLTMAGTKEWKPGLSPDRRMRQAAVKPESEVIADPRGTAVNSALLPRSPHAGRTQSAVGERKPNPIP